MDVFQAAQAFENEGRLDQAIAEYGRLADNDVDASQALLRRAMLERQIGAVGAAIASLERANAIDAGNPHPLMRLGEIAADVGRPMAAAQCMQAAVQTALQSGDHRWIVEARVGMAAAYARLSYLDLAYRTARSLPDNLADSWASTRHEGLTRRRDAHGAVLALLRRRRGAVPLSDEDRLTLAQGLLSLGRLRMAAALCSQLISRHPQLDLLVYFMTDILTWQFGPDHALAFLRSHTRLPRGAKEFMGSELRLLQEIGVWEDILDRMDEDHETEQFPHTHHAVMMAMLVLDRRAELERYCLDWMGRTPQEVAPAACLAFLSARRNGLANRSSHGRRAAPGASLHVVQFWNADTVPDDVRRGMDSWTRLHPHWRHSVFSQSSARAFLAARFDPTTVAAFDACSHPAMMADFFRVAFLYANGGLYADADEVCLRPLDAMLPDMNHAEILAPLSGGFPGFVDNSFMGARAGSRVLKSVLDDMIWTILSDVQAGRRSVIWAVTGPGALTRGVARYIGEQGVSASGLFLLPIQQHRTFIQTETDLAYKRDPAANWRLS